MVFWRTAKGFCRFPQCQILREKSLQMVINGNRDQESIKTALASAASCCFDRQKSDGHRIESTRKPVAQRTLMQSGNAVTYGNKRAHYIYLNTIVTIFRWENPSMNDPEGLTNVWIPMLAKPQPSNKTLLHGSHATMHICMSPMQEHGRVCTYLSVTLQTLSDHKKCTYYHYIIMEYAYEQRQWKLAWVIMWRINWTEIWCSRYLPCHRLSAPRTVNNVYCFIYLSLRYNVCIINNVLT